MKLSTAAFPVLLPISVKMLTILVISSRTLLYCVTRMVKSLHEMAALVILLPLVSMLPRDPVRLFIRLKRVVSCACNSGVAPPALMMF